MKLRRPLAWLRELAWFFFGASVMRAVVNDAARESRRHRPYGPETIPKGVPADIPVYSRRGFRQVPSYEMGPFGSQRLVYLPREEFETVVTYCELQLREHGWMITETYDDVGEDFRARRFDVLKKQHRGSVAVTESVDHVGPIDLRLVKVSVDLQPVEQAVHTPQ